MNDCVTEIPAEARRVFTLGLIHINRKPDREWALDNSRREFLVRLSTDDDHPMIADDRREALCRGFKRWATSVTIIRLRDSRKWIFAERTVSFPNGFRNTDAHARARLAVNARVGGGAR
jgi:hypothetical protein